MQLPDQIKQIAATHWQRLIEAWPEAESKLTRAQSSTLIEILGLSDFVAEQLCRHPEWIMPLFDNLTELERKNFNEELKQLLADSDSEEQTYSILRAYRNRQMVALAWRDFTSTSTLEESLLDLSALAEALIIQARDWLYEQMCQRYGTPCDCDGNPQPLLILGMGKLGGRELNFSSDIDLIFTFPEHGETVGGRRTMENQQFFIKMGQYLVNLLDKVTAGGFVYRVDMRLRPYGESGPLVVSFSGLEDYYQEQGREWERYAMVKVRALGPWSPFCDELHTLIRPFVYRRYIDFSAIESLRKMKQLITQEVRRRKLFDNIKLGSGGIREAEFVVQSFQLIRGGREPNLREPSLLKALSALTSLGQLESGSSEGLKQSYLLLRRVENLLQAIDDKQTQTLPNNSLDWQRLCYVLKIATEGELRDTIDSAMGCIHNHFVNTIGGDEQEDSSELWTQLLWSNMDSADAQQLLEENGISDAELWPLLSQWRKSTLKRSIGPRGRETLDKLMPLLLEEVILLNCPSQAFSCISKVIDQILTRTTYLELLYENLGARQQLVRLCHASPWIGTQLARFPMLLDELIDPAHLYATTSLDDYPSELRQYLLRVPEGDMEQQLEALRQFKLSQQLKIAAADVTGLLHVSQVSEHLTQLAEAIIEQVVNQAWQQITARHGIPPHLAKDQDKTHRGFAVIGYGKAGGIELGYGSDLDLVFLHNYSREKYGAQGETDGQKPIEVGHFYLKLAQRILHLFSTRTTSGELYEIDMRLRPSGSSGLLVSEINYFAEYQQQEAWTWEHQALVRARFMYGDTELAQQFSDIRTEILTMERNSTKLAQEVRDMRLKMRDHLLKSKQGMFDLKQGVGGIADIEFMGQYWVLAFSHRYRELTKDPDNLGIFNTLAELGLMESQQVETVIKAYFALRHESNRLNLQQLPALIDSEQVEFHTQKIAALYQQLLE